MGNSTFRWLLGVDQRVQLLADHLSALGVVGRGQLGSEIVRRGGGGRLGGRGGCGKIAMNVQV